MRLLLVAALALLPLPASAQGDPVRGDLLRLGGWTDDRVRLAELLGRDPGFDLTMRSTSDLLAAAGGDREGEFTWILPSLRTTWNSDLPFTFNDGSLWAGRGFSGVLTGGATVRAGRFRVVLAPELVFEQNADFQTITFPDREGRNEFSNPFHPAPRTIDLPLRFGEGARTRVTPGQSSVRVDLGSFAAGVSSENRWWGPGIRNAIVLSDHAPGFPHLFLTTPRPVETPLGTVGGQWILGRLAESDFFDRDGSNDHNTISGLVVTIRPAPVPDLTLGFARAVVAPLEDGDIGLGAALDVFSDTGRPNSLDASEVEPGPDQVFSFFGRWAFPGAGFEAYAEWARFERPASLRDFLETPNHSQGYTVGLQWVRSLSESRGAGAGAAAADDPSVHPSGAPWPLLRLQGELTNVEPSSTFELRPLFSYYTSQSVAQGYTHRGQLLGASIGPAASSQWLAGDYLRQSWSIGAYWGRIRWNNAVLFTPVVPFPKREDVTIFYGIRGGFEYRGVRLEGSLDRGLRLNYLFQSFQPDPVTGKADGVDIVNHRLMVTVSAAGGWSPLGGPNDG